MNTGFQHKQQRYETWTFQKKCSDLIPSIKNTGHRLLRSLYHLLYLITFIYILCLVIRNIFARIFRTLTARIDIMLFTALDKRTLFAKLKNLIRSAALTVDFFKRNIQTKSLFIKALRLSPQVIVILLCCYICSR